MTVSIIIAVKRWQDNLRHCLAKCLELDYPEFEIIILPDAPFKDTLCPGEGCPEVRVIPTGPVSPAEKRDIALEYVKGEILAFIDDDAYPAKSWLKDALENFKVLDVAAVGGPAITPPTDNSRQQASGCIYASLLTSGRFTYRYMPKKSREVDDYPSCNFLVRKSVLQELGGFHTDFWPGEDTKLCLDITKRLQKKIIYDPKVLVYHHRREVFLPHLRQVANYALHRGYFVKEYPQTSLRLTYFIPSLFILGLISGAILVSVFTLLKPIYLTVIILYLALAFFATFSAGLRLAPLVFPGIMLTHLTYGMFFLKGLLAKRLREEK